MNMENWFDMLVQSGLLVAIVTFITKLFQLLNVLVEAKVNEIAENIKNKKLKEYILSAEESVRTGVLTVAQELGDVLKEKAADGKLTESEKKMLKELCIEKVTTMISDNVKEAVIILKGDFDAWLNNSIEAFIKKIKMEQK